MTCFPFLGEKTTKRSRNEIKTPQSTPTHQFENLDFVV